MDEYAWVKLRRTLSSGHVARIPAGTRVFVPKPVACWLARDNAASFVPQGPDSAMLEPPAENMAKPPARGRPRRQKVRLRK